MSLSYSRLKAVVFAYISLPVFLFLTFFLRISIALPSIAVYGAMLYFALRSERREEEKKIELSTRIMFLLFLAVLAWTFLGGLNGHWFQTTDWDCRNAIFRDLITHTWPVRYANGSALVYYIGHWLPVAAISKIVLRLGGLDMAWAVGQNLLWLWTAVGVYLVLLLLLVYHEVKTSKQVLLVALLFVFFSGMDLIGAIATKHIGNLLSPEVMHLEWWTSHYQFSSLTTCIYWVFNQTVVPWLTVICFLFERTPANYIFLFVACLACGPFPAVGLAALMFARGIEYLVQGLRTYASRKYFAKLLYPGNLLGTLTIVPIYLVYYGCNNATNDMTAYRAEGIAALQNVSFVEKSLQWFAENFKVSVIYFAIFFVLEAGLYLILLYCDKKSDVLYYAVWVSLLLFPHFHIGKYIDFCMRVSIPALFVLMVFCGEAILRYCEERKKSGHIKRMQIRVLVVCLLIGAATPCVEIGRGFYHVAKEKTTALSYDPIYSFETQPVMYNFSTEFPDKTIFFQYLAR